MKRIKSFAKLSPHYYRKNNIPLRSVLKPFSASDLPFLAISLIITLYLTFTDPLFLTIFGCATLVFLSLWHFLRVIPLIEKALGIKIRFLHLTTGILTITILLALINPPAHALFLSGLEEFFQELVQGAQASGSGQTISSDVVDLIFNLIRGSFLLLVAAASLFAYNQAQQGNDWRPIITQVGLAFAVVIAIDVVTFMFVGTT